MNINTEIQASAPLYPELEVPSQNVTAPLSAQSVAISIFSDLATLQHQIKRRFFSDRITYPATSSSSIDSRQTISLLSQGIAQGIISASLQPSQSMTNVGVGNTSSVTSHHYYGNTGQSSRVDNEDEDANRSNELSTPAAVTTVTVSSIAATGFAYTFGSIYEDKSAAQIRQLTTQRIRNTLENNQDPYLIERMTQFDLILTHLEEMDRQIITSTNLKCGFLFAATMSALGGAIFGLKSNKTWVKVSLGAFIFTGIGGAFCHRSMDVKTKIQAMFDHNESLLRQLP